MMAFDVRDRQEPVDLRLDDELGMIERQRNSQEAHGVIDVGSRTLR